jgi:hypothetical protein
MVKSNNDFTEGLNGIGNKNYELSQAITSVRVMVQRTRVNLKISRWRVKVSAFGLMAQNMRVNRLTTSRMGRVGTHGQVAKNIRVKVPENICRFCKWLLC